MPIHVVAAIIRRADGRVLACRRGPGKSSAGLWEFPGGKVEAGEDPGDALVRELHEELGVSVRLVEPFTDDVTGGIRLSCFLVELIGEEPTESSDHDVLRWLARGELDTVTWSEPDVPAIRRLAN
jgi:8-oxo-dGTP diphosphatase